jgi:hypothetical protein
MRQRGFRCQAKKDRFEDGVLRADSCMDRYSMPRDMQYRTAFEDLPSLSFGVSALREERRLQAKAAALASKGFRPCHCEPLEDFTERHSDILEDMGR